MEVGDGSGGWRLWLWMMGVMVVGDRDYGCGCDGGCNCGQWLCLCVMRVVVVDDGCDCGRWLWVMVAGDGCGGFLRVRVVDD